ncbi:MAG: DUF305 domain-containing protein [Actinomycetota bacterium]|nr:DUF305 domain-containing protein [Actinomycetota bacterium]
MTTRTITTLVAAAATAVTISAALGGCGSTATPPASSSASSSQVAQEHNQADITFAQGMIPHHTQAIAMSQMAAQRAALPQVKDLAARIQSAQEPEIDQLSGLLRAWNASMPSADNPTVHRRHDSPGQPDHGDGGAMPGMMSADQMRQVGQASGDAFDRMFLQMMIVHHRGAVTMAQDELSDGKNAEARQLAQRIIDAQQREITKMQALLGG